MSFVYCTILFDTKYMQYALNLYRRILFERIIEAEKDLYAKKT